MHHTEIVCPFCSLACDDLEVTAEGTTLRVTANGCALAADAFARPLGHVVARIDGEAVEPEVALARAAEILGESRRPLVAGLGTDTAGVRAAMALAERLGGIVDHAGGAGLAANLAAMQSGGWVTTTLAEVHNRADLVVFIGTDTSAVAPRLVDRWLAARQTLFHWIRRELVWLGEKTGPTAGWPSSHLPCLAEDLPEVLLALRALQAGNRPQAEQVRGIAVEQLAQLMRRIENAQYPLLVWSAGELAAPHADLVTGEIAGLLQALNLKGRASGLPLAGPDNVIGANQVCTWQSGVPLRTSFAAGVPDHDPHRLGTETLIADGGIDSLLWIATWHDRQPPASQVPTIVVGRPGMTLDRARRSFSPPARLASITPAASIARIASWPCPFAPYANGSPPRERPARTDREGPSGGKLRACS